MKYTLLIAGLLLGLVSCTTGNCRQNHKSPISPAKKVVEMGSPLNKVRVFKYDGSLQCGMGEAVSLEEMQKQLKDIKVFSAVNKPDGLMHIQQCGTNTGMANVYEIDSIDLEKALSLGFRQWTFD